MPDPIPDMVPAAEERARELLSEKSSRWDDPDVEIGDITAFARNNFRDGVLAGRARLLAALEEERRIMREEVRRFDQALIPCAVVADTIADLRNEIETAINRHSAENGSNTPDFILAQYLVDCLAAWDKAMQARERWYGRPIEGEPLR